MNTRFCKISLVSFSGGMVYLLSAAPSMAQIEVTGGSATINNADIFVPTDGAITGTTPTGQPLSTTTDDRAVVFGGTLDTSTLVIQTEQGNVPADALFRTSTFPTIDALTEAEFMGGAGLANATGSLLGTLSFRAIGGDGASFFNIPTALDFQVAPTTTPLTPTPFTEFRADGFILTETGFATDIGGFGVVERETPVTLVQYQPEGSLATGQVVLNNFVPAVAYAAERGGTAVDVESLDLSFTSGTLETPPGFSLTEGALITETAILATTTIDDTARVDAISVFNRPNIVVLPAPSGNPVRPTLFVGNVQVFPVLPVFVAVGVFTFRNVPTGVWCDPPAADGFEYEMTPRAVRVGALSRVFPGMSGVGEADDAVFTRISGFPTGVDADDTFVVSVEGTVLGEFSPGDILQFSDYAEMLGDRLVNGGVRKFTVSEINPAVDASDPVAFPLKLDFNTPTASFDMRALEVAATGDAAQELSALTTE